MSNGYVPYFSRTAFDSMPLTVPGEDVSKTFSGADGFSSVADKMQTEPQTQNEVPSGKIDWLDKNNLLVSGGLFSKSVLKVDEAKSQTIRESLKPYLYAALFVVIGLFLISRGFGLIGEEGASVLVELSPEKFPGIGHAVHAMRKGK